MWHVAPVPTNMTAEAPAPVASACDVLRPSNRRSKLAETQAAPSWVGVFKNQGPKKALPQKGRALTRRPTQRRPPIGSNAQYQGCTRNHVMQGPYVDVVFFGALKNDGS